MLIYYFVTIIIMIMTMMISLMTLGAMCRWIDPSWWTHWAISRVSQCYTTGVTKAVVCVILFVG